MPTETVAIGQTRASSQEALDTIHACHPCKRFHGSGPEAAVGRLVVKRSVPVEGRLDHNGRAGKKLTKAPRIKCGAPPSRAL